MLCAGFNGATIQNGEGGFCEVSDFALLCALSFARRRLAASLREDGRGRIVSARIRAYQPQRRFFASLGKAKENA